MYNNKHIATALPKALTKTKRVICCWSYMMIVTAIFAVTTKQERQEWK